MQATRLLQNNNPPQQEFRHNILQFKGIKKQILLTP